MLSISFISQDSRPRFTSVIKSLAPYLGISFHYKHKEIVLRRELEKVSRSIERISVQDNERRKVMLRLRIYNHLISCHCFVLNPTVPCTLKQL